MRYTELKIFANSDISEAVQAALIEAGFDSMQIDDAMDAKDIADNPGLYKYDYLSAEIAGAAEAAESINIRDIVITLYFPDDEEGHARLAEAEALLSGLRDTGFGSGSADFGSDGSAPGSDPADSGSDASVCVSGLKFEFGTELTGDDSEWLYKWQEYFKPVKPGERIVVKPGWEEYVPSENELVIEMDPGMAFGSGLHETTSMCIRALEESLSARICGKTADRGMADRSESERDATYRDAADRSESERGAADIDDSDIGAADSDTYSKIRMLDVGTGTGILAIAAALLGASECLGIDIDDEAVRVAGENVKRNGLEGRIMIAKGDLMDGTDFEADIIVANLMADLVIKLAPAAAAHLKSGGIFISSGILDIKEETVAAAIQAAGFTIKEIMTGGEWRAIIAIRK